MFKKILVAFSMSFALMSLDATPANAQRGPGASTAATATATAAPPQSFVPPRTDAEQKEFCEAQAKCQPAGNGGTPSKKEPVKAAQYICEGPTWTEEVEGKQVPKTAGAHNKVPGNLGTVCVCDNADFFPVAVHGTGKTVRNDAEMVVTQFTIMCVPKDTKLYESMLARITTRLESLETRQTEDDGFRDFVKRDLAEHDVKLIDHAARLGELEQWRKDVDCDLYGLNCPAGKVGAVPALREDVDALKARGSGLGLTAGAFYLGTPGGRVGGGMLSAIARYQPGTVGVEGVLRGFYSPDFLNGNTSYTGGGSVAMLGGGAAVHLTLSPFENRRIRLLAGPGFTYMARVSKGPNEEARQGYAITPVELGIELPLGNSGLVVRPMVAPAYGVGGKADGKHEGWGISTSLGLGFMW